MEAASEAAEAANGVSLVAGFAAEVPERLQQREAERREEAGRRRREREALAVREEQSDYFAAEFSRERAAAEALLGPERDAEAVSEAARRLQELQRLLTDAVRFLAPYEVRQAQAALARLQDALAERRLQLQPKKRFAFKKGLRKEPQPTPTPTPPTQQQQPESQQGPREEEEEEEEPGCGFSRAEDQELELGPAELLQRDVVLSQLSRCRVRLRGNPNALTLRGLRDCTVLCGPVSTSAMVDDCAGCVVALACQQLRTHLTTRTSFYLQVTCRAMLEDCSDVRFAPYSWAYEGIDADFETSGLDRSRDYWSQVDDFNWLARNEPSPNWSVIPENERIADWD